MQNGNEPDRAAAGDSTSESRPGVSVPRGGGEQTLSRLIANLPGVAYRCANDNNWTMEFLSEGCMDLTGYAPHELIQNRDICFNDLVLRDYRRSLRAQVLDTVARGQLFELEYPIRTKTGEMRWVWERGVGVFSPDGRPVAFEGYLADSTKRKRCEEDLRQNEERLRLMVEHLPTGAVYREENNLFLNKAAEEITGFSREELPTMQAWFRKLYGRQHKERRRLYEESRASAFPARRVLPIRTKHGEQRWVEFAAYAYEKGEIWLLHDITALKKTEEDLRVYQHQLRSLASELTLSEDRERRRIATDLHDGPGQALSMAHMKLEMLRKLQTDQEACVLLEEARRLVDQALGDTHAMTFSLSSPMLHQVGLVPALKQLCNDMATQYGGTFFVREDEWPSPLESELRMILFRCVRELLINAAKHAEASQATVHLSRDRHHLQIIVEDDGIGFDTSDIGCSLSPSGGFGLFNMHEYLNHMGGSLEIRSAPGAGTRVRVVVPLPTDRQKTTALQEGIEHHD